LSDAAEGAAARSEKRAMREIEDAALFPELVALGKLPASALAVVAARSADAELIALIARYREQRDKTQAAFEASFPAGFNFTPFNAEAAVMAEMRRSITDTVARTPEGLHAMLAVALEIMNNGGDVPETADMKLRERNTIPASAVRDAIAAFA
jgi:hypothetical protein